LKLRTSAPITQGERSLVVRLFRRTTYEPNPGTEAAMSTSDDQNALREKKALDQLGAVLSAVLTASPDDEMIEQARLALVELACLTRERQAAVSRPPKHPHLVDHQVRGTEVASAKLTDEKVRAIRREERTRAEIGAEYGISKGTVSSVWARRTWKHVED
jgi:hypothetical protein